MASAYLSPNGRMQYFNPLTGTFLSAGLVYTYYAGTSNPAPTWADANQVTVNSNPVVLDAFGSASIFWSGAYKVTVTDALGNLVYTQDNISVPTSPLISVSSYGTTGGGTVSDSTAINNANTAAAGTDLYFPKGNYLIGTSITLTAHCVFAMGAILQIGNGVTVTFSGPISAGIYQIFNVTGSGAVVAAAATTSVGYAEWFGAVPNSTSVDNSIPINQCITTFTATQLQCAQYFTLNPILLAIANRSLLGVIEALSGNESSTPAVIMQSASATIIQVGPNAFSTLQNTNAVKNIAFGRNVAPVKTGTSIGVACQYTVWTTIENVESYDSNYNFQFMGTSNLRARRCTSVRATASTGSGTDLYYGFFVNGGGTSIGGAGGNESLYMEHCFAGISVSYVTGVNYQGIVASGANGYSDLFISNCSSSNLGYGINLIGNNDSGATPDVMNEDVRIYNQVSDLCHIAGIQFYQTSLYGSIQMIGGYLDMASGAAAPCIQYTNSHGQVFVTGVQMLCSNGGANYGVQVVGSNNIQHVGNQIVQAPTTAITLSGVTNSSFEDSIVTNNVATGFPAITVGGTCTRLNVKCQVAGTTGAWSIGVSLTDSTTSLSEFNGSRVNASAITGAKLSNNGTAITTVGTFGTANYASGVVT